MTSTGENPHSAAAGGAAERELLLRRAEAAASSDPGAAARILRELEQSLTDRADPAWIDLAHAYAKKVDDRTAARRCLDTVRDSRQRARQHLELARLYLDLVGDAEAARELLVRAEAVADGATTYGGRPDSQLPVDLACAWRMLGDPEHSRRWVEAALAKASTAVACTQLVQRWSQGPRADRDAAFERARSLASTFDEWFRLATACRGFDRNDLLACLQQAGLLATTRLERHEVGRMLREAGRDDEAARFDVGSFRPDDLVAPGPSPLGWQRDASALLDWLRVRVDDDALAAIIARRPLATQQAFLAELRDVRGAGRVDLPLRELTAQAARWRHWYAGAPVDAHARAFCVLLLCFEELHGSDRGDAPWLFAALVESCAALGKEALQRLPGLLCTFLDPPRDREEAAPFAALALLLTAVRLGPDDARLERLARLTLAHDTPSIVSGTEAETAAHWRALVDPMLAHLPRPQPRTALARLCTALRMRV